MAQRVENSRIRVIIDGKVAETALRELEASARKAKSELRGMAETDPKRKQLLKDFQDLNKEIQKQRKDLNDTRTAWQKTTDQAKGFFVGTLGANIATSALSSIWQGFTNVIKVQKEFESSLKNLSAITGLTGNDLKFMGNEAIKLSITTGVAARDIVEGYKLIASAKPELLTQKELLAQVTKETITLSKASGLDLPEAARRLTDVMNQFNVPAEKAGKVVNILAEGAKLSAAEVPEVSEAMLKFGVAANASNVSVAESVALVETLAEKGLKGAEAGTQMRNVLAKLSAPETLPTQALKYLQAAGVNIDKLKDKTIPFNQRLEELSKITGNAAALVEVFGLENKNAAQILLENRERVKQLTDALSKDGLNSAYEQAETNTQTLANSQMKLAATWDAIMTKQGGISKFFGTLINWLTNAIIQFDNMGAVINIWANKLTGGLIEIKDSTYDTALEVDSSVQKMLSKYSSMSDFDFLKKADQFRKEFTEKAVKDGEAFEEADRLFGRYIMKRRQALIDNANAKKANMQNAPSGPSGPGSAADLIIPRDSGTKSSTKSTGKSRAEKQLEWDKHLKDLKLKQMNDDLKWEQNIAEQMLLIEKENLAKRIINKDEFAKREIEIKITSANAQLEIARRYGESELKFQTDLINAKGELDLINYQAQIDSILNESIIADQRLQIIRENALLENELTAETEEAKYTRQIEIELQYEDASYGIKLQSFMAEMELKRLNGELTIAEESRINNEIASLKLAHLVRVNRLKKESVDAYLAQEAREANTAKQLIADYGNTVTNVMSVLGANTEAVTAFQKMTALMQIGIDTAMAISSIIKYASMDPKNALTGGLDIPLKIGSGILTVTANMLRAKEMLTAPMPAQPQMRGFIGGGFTGSGSGILDNNGDKVAGIVHANEYVINPRMLKDPTILSILPALEANRMTGAPLIMNSQPEKVIEKSEVIKEVGFGHRLDELIKALSKPVKFEIDDEAAFKIQKRIDDVKDRDSFING